jgi:hypothetical protein
MEHIGRLILKSELNTENIMLAIGMLAVPVSLP